jgi:hypothetical protein
MSLLALLPAIAGFTLPIAPLTPSVRMRHPTMVATTELDELREVNRQLQRDLDALGLRGADRTLLTSAEPQSDEPSVKQLLQRIKDAGVAGAVSYAGWELLFWVASVPVCFVAFYGVSGHFPDFSNQDDVAALGAEAFAFVNVARFAVPLRIGLALSTAPWVQANVIDRVSPIFQSRSDQR